MKIIRIKNCISCPNSKFDDLKVLFCDAIPPIGKEITDKYSIPKWCPLEDAEELEK